MVLKINRTLFYFFRNLIKLKKFLVMSIFVQKGINLFIRRGLIFLFFVGMFLFNGEFVFAESSLNAGVVNGIWYSQFPFFAGDKVKINLAIQNQTNYGITGKVQFYDYNLLIGESDFSAGEGRLIVAQIEYKFTAGKHKISTKLADVKKSEFGKTSEEIILKSDSLEDSEVFVDTDTDKDGVGNVNDLDDDNDELDDKKEAVLGTNLLNPDSDGDGVSDGEEVSQGSNPLVPEEKSEGEVSGVKSSVLGAVDEAGNIIEKTDNFFKDIAETIREKEVAIQEEAKKDNNYEPIISTASLITIEKVMPSFKIVKERIPMKEDIKSLLFKIAIFIFRKWWLFLMGILILTIWGIKKKRHNRRNP